jgi:glutamine synthetase
MPIEEINQIEAIHQIIREKRIKFIDLRFADTFGKDQHMTVCVNKKEDVDHLLSHGKAFDGSSIREFKKIDSSDMLLIPDPSTAKIDPFFDEPTLILRCDIIEPATMISYERDPRAVTKKAEEYLQASGIADHCYLGDEPEFFILDHVVWKVEMNRVHYRVDSKEGRWNCDTEYTNGNIGHRPGIKGGYFPLPPIDSSQDIRTAMCVAAMEVGLVVETQHHEVATGGQVEINIKYDTLCKKADNTQLLKYIVHNVAHSYGKTATFMPKPLVGDNGSGMHCHISLVKNGTNLFSGNEYAGLSEMALYFIGGIIKHGRSLNAFTNPTTNSYKRLVPGFEAPVMLAYSARNRSAAIRIPYVSHPEAARIEIRFPDPSANPYFAFSALLMAGMDGIVNRILPGDPMDQDLYELKSDDKTRTIPTVCGYLDEALAALQKDHDYLLKGGVFTKDLIDSYIILKSKEVMRLRMITHPVEFDMYYSV